MLRSLRLDTGTLPASSLRAPACVHSATQTPFIAGPLAAILPALDHQILCYFSKIKGVKECP